jgi:hypothetical protein
MPKLLPHSRKKGSLLHLLLPEQNRSSQFLFPPICRQEGIWSFDLKDLFLVFLTVQKVGLRVSTAPAEAAELGHARGRVT